MPRLRSTLIAVAMEERRLAAAHGALHAHLQGNGAPGHAAETGRLEREVTTIREGMRALLAEFDALGVVCATSRWDSSTFPVSATASGSGSAGGS